MIFDAAPWRGSRRVLVADGQPLMGVRRDGPAGQGRRRPGGPCRRAGATRGCRGAGTGAAVTCHSVRAWTGLIPNIRTWNRRQHQGRSGRQAATVRRCFRRCCGTRGTPTWPASVAQVKNEMTVACQNPNVVAEPTQVNFACAKGTNQTLWAFSLLTRGDNPSFTDPQHGRNGSVVMTQRPVGHEHAQPPEGTRADRSRTGRRRRLVA